MVVKEGYKQTEVGIIPVDWDVGQVGSLTSKIGSGITPTGGERVYKKIGRPFVRSQNVLWGKMNLKDMVYIDERTHKSFEGTEIKENDVLLNISGASIGRSVVAYKTIVGGNVNQHVCIIRPTGSYVHYQFLCSYLLSEKGQKFINDFQTGGNRQGLNFKQIATIIMPIPSLPEQKAIATALSDIDDLINSLTKLIEKKKNIKQGAMQELLTGKKRLGGFSGEWVEVKLGDICQIKKGQLITEKDAVKGNIPVIAGGKQPAYYHNKANRIGNTITISASGVNAGYVAYHEEPIFASDCSTIENSESYNLYIIYSNLALRQNMIFLSQTGGAQPHVQPRDLMLLSILLPPTIEEQTAIATILSDMDSEIETLQTKLDKYKAIKQGMMQELLMGRIRLLEGA